jgi:hypothetical protein
VSELTGAICECGHRVTWHHDIRGCGYHGYAAGHRCPCSLSSDAVVEGIVERATADAEARGRDAGIRQAIQWLQADYEYGTGPDWRERGCEWIADRAAEERIAALDAPTTDADLTGPGERTRWGRG